jgi:hypothetical protein
VEVLCALAYMLGLRCCGSVVCTSIHAGVEVLWKCCVHWHTCWGCGAVEVLCYVEKMSLAASVNLAGPTQGKIVQTKML